MRKPKQVQETIELIHKKFNIIDVLHNNAPSKGKSTENFLKTFENYKLSTWNDVIGLTKYLD